jgi:hypothetical protein
MNWDTPGYWQWGLDRNETLRQNLSSFITYLIYQQFCNKSSRKGGTCGVGTTCPSGSYVFTPVWWRGSWCSFFGTLSHHLDLVLSCIVLLFVSANFSYGHIPSSRCGIIQPLWSLERWFIFVLYWIHSRISI